MQFKNIMIIIAGVAVGVEGKALYKNCKCFDKTTGVQNNTITEMACNEYRKDVPAKVKYSALPWDHHSCMRDDAIDDGDLLSNHLFDLKCWKVDHDFEQRCWGKKGPMEKK